MKILIDIGHPADVHFFKNIAQNLVDCGHDIKITARKKDVVIDLLEAYNFDYELVGGFGKSMLQKVHVYIKKSLTLYKVVKKYKPDVLIGFANPFVAQIGYFVNIPSIIFTDTEHAKLANLLSFPFATTICTPKCYYGKIPSKKHMTFNGYKELAYLHPNNFTPNPDILVEMGLNEDSTIIVLRFVSWEASHDVGQGGIVDKEYMIEKLEKYGRIIVTSEHELDEKFEKYRMNILPEKMHDLLYYESLYIGEGATMASECAVLGTPAIYVNTLRLGYTDEEEEIYNLVFNFSDVNVAKKQVIVKAVELLEDKDLKNICQIKRNELLNHTQDVTKFVTDYVHAYLKNIEKYNT